MEERVFDVNPGGLAKILRSDSGEKAASPSSRACRQPEDGAGNEEKKQHPPLAAIDGHGNPDDPGHFDAVAELIHFSLLFAELRT